VLRSFTSALGHGVYYGRTLRFERRGGASRDVHMATLKVEIQLPTRADGPVFISKGISIVSVLLVSVLVSAKPFRVLSTCWDRGASMGLA
jgi:hypothetical protein